MLVDTTLGKLSCRHYRRLMALDLSWQNLSVLQCAGLARGGSKKVGPHAPRITLNLERSIVAQQPVLPYHIHVTCVCVYWSRMALLTKTDRRW